MFLLSEQERLFDIPFERIRRRVLRQTAISRDEREALRIESTLHVLERQSARRLHNTRERHSGVARAASMGPSVTKGKGAACFDAWGWYDPELSPRELRDGSEELLSHALRAAWS
jgi:hypothetical protein